MLLFSVLKSNKKAIIARGGYKIYHANVAKKEIFAKRQYDE